MASKYLPFHDLNHLIKSALLDAIDWEQSRYDAGCGMTPQGQAEISKRVHAYKKRLNDIAPGCKSSRDAMHAELDELVESGQGKMMTVKEIQTAHRKRKGKCYD